MTANDDELVDHLLTLTQWIDRTIRMTQDIPYARFRSELVAQLALCKSIEQCREVSIRIIKRWPDFVAAHPEIEFRQAQATRHRIAHAYDSLDLDLIWATAETSIPKMSAALKRVLARMAPDERP